jgi:excisionase family DNA binding protein
MGGGAVAQTQAAEFARWISLDEAAKRCSVDTTTVRRWIAAGELTGYKVGPKLLRVNAADVDALFIALPTVASQQYL